MLSTYSKKCTVFVETYVSWYDYLCETHIFNKESI